MPRVLVLDTISEIGLQMLRDAPDIEFDVQTGLKGDELRQALLRYEGALCRSGVKITADVLEGNRTLKAIVRAGVGTDNIDKAAATRAGIVVMNTPTGNTLSTAEHAFTLILALSRNISPAHQSLKSGVWERKSYMGSQLADKTLGVIGLGRIGQEVAKRALAFDMRVIGFDPLLSAEQAKKLGIEQVGEPRAMLPRVNYLTVHTPLNEHTRHLISHDEIKMLPKGARLINCARGGIYDEAALLAGLKSGHLGGVALDVFEVEPCTESPLFSLPNVLCTPHLGASTSEAQTQVAIEAVQLLIAYLTTGEIRHPVNMMAMDPKTLKSLQGYVDVAYRLGLLLSQWHGQSGLSKCNLTYRGEVAEKDTRLLSAAFCAGVLEHSLEEDVNIINAETLLKDRGIELVEHRDSQKGAFRSSMAATVTHGEHSYSAAGTLFGDTMPRLIRLANYRLEAYLDGNLLLFSHEDVPGIIGNVGTIFGRHQINIAQMAVGRASDSPGDKAIGVLNLDGIPLADAVQEIAAISGVHRVAAIQLPPAGETPKCLR
ncbi:MAG TPA: phosphoglycerate dehydrogenase [Planctomycetes bacterium]|nr:phosphoglycerate dehydrogenase [Planctomycetota bacterium]